MQDYPLYKALKKLSLEEIAQFAHFVDCPTFNTNQRLCKLVHYIKEFHPTYSIDQDLLFKELYGDKTFEVQKLRDVRSLLFRLLKRFLVILEVENRQDWSDLALLKQFRERQLPSLFQSYSKSMDKRQSAAYSNQQLLMNHLKAEELDRFSISGQLRLTKDHLQPMMNELDAFYISKKLKWTCEMFNRSGIVNTNYDIHFFEDILRIIEENHLHLHNPIISLYYLAYLTLTQPEIEQHFLDFKKLLDESHDKIEKEDAVSLYRYAQNYCIRRVNEGKSHYMQELFEIYKSLLQKDLLNDGGFLPHPHYKNMVTLGLRLKEYEWTHQFIEQYQHSLESNIRANAYHFNLATFYYETKKFDEVVELLNRVSFSDVYYEISSKYILMKVYYDLNELDLLGYLMASFEKFIKRNKAISVKNRPGILHFLMVLKKLSKIKEWKSYKKKAFILQQKEKTQDLLERKKPIVNVVWLKQKLEEIA